MAANDGQRLVVFGLTMREHHTLRMQQILREYKIDLPPAPSNRSALFLALFGLAKGLDEEESQGIENWLSNGGPFPTPPRYAVPEPQPEPVPSQHSRRASRYVKDEDDDTDNDENEDPDEVMGGTELEDNGEEWQEYDEEAFNQAPVVFADGEHEGANANHAGRQNEGITQNNANGSETTVRREEISDSESESSEEENEEITRGPPPRNAGYPARGGYRGGYHGRYRRGPVQRHHEMEVDNENYDAVDERDVKDSGSSTLTTEKEIECAICADSLPISSFPAKNITSTCDHDHDERACFSCVEGSIASTLSEGALHRLNCVFCPELFSKSEIKTYGSKSSYTRYEYLLLLSNPSITMCLNPHCRSGQVHTDPDNPKMICKECSFAICALHKVPFHEGQTCFEFDQSSTAIQRLEEAEATAKLLASDHSKICPSCGEGITKTEGCDHLMCRCGQSWCFVCLASWDNIMRIGESAHASSCPYNPNHQGTGRTLARNPTNTANDPRTRDLTNLVHGGPISAALAEARSELNHRRNARIRVEAREAAEKRMRAMEANKTEEKKNEEAARKRRKTKLTPAWEEGGVRKH